LWFERNRAKDHEDATEKTPTKYNNYAIITNKMSLLPDKPLSKSVFQCEFQCKICIPVLGVVGKGCPSSPGKK